MEEKKFTPVKWTTEEEYVAVRIPDKMLIASILNEARGKRTMAQLADACQISASTLSRAVNGKITKPMTVELIKSIAEHSEHYSATLFERLARANGLMPRKQYEERKESKSKRIYSRLEERRALRTKAQNIIMNELVKRGISVTLVNRRDAEVPSSYGQSMPLDFAVETDLGEGTIKWSFLIIPYTLPDIIGDGRLPVGFFLRQTIQNMSGWFLTDAWAPETLKNRLHTFLFLEGTVYTFFEDSLVCGPEVNSDFSFVTLDMDSEKVNFEIYMRRKDGKMHDSIFARPVVVDNEEQDSAWQIREDAEEYLVSDGEE